MLLAGGFSAYQYATTGSISWIKGYATRPEAGWRKATDVIEELGAAREAVPHEFDKTGQVVRVASGDIVHVLLGGGEQSQIRLYGVDAPEQGQPYYRESKDFLGSMINGQTVGIKVMEKDSYGRTEGTIYLDGENINLAMVEGGHAWWYHKYAKYDRPLKEAERQARAGKLGLWAAPDPISPWKWRRR